MTQRAAPPFLELPPFWDVIALMRGGARATQLAVRPCTRGTAFHPRVHPSKGRGRTRRAHLVCEARYSSTSNTTLEARGETVPSSVTARTSSLKMPACSVTSPCGPPAPAWWKTSPSAGTSCASCAWRPPRRRPPAAPAGRPCAPRRSPCRRGSWRCGTGRRRPRRAGTCPGMPPRSRCSCRTRRPRRRQPTSRRCGRRSRVGAASPSRAPVTARGPPPGRRRRSRSGARRGA